MPKYQFKNVIPKRSKMMSAIRGKNTSIEVLLRRQLHKMGYRYRIHYKKVPGSPDIAFVNKKVAIFCDSGFWHGKNWSEKKKKIKTNRDYWIPKIEKNIERDKKATFELKKMGWKVLRFWDDDIKNDLENVVESIVAL